MGQYHYICNMDRKEYLNPHAFGDGLKLMEFGGLGGGTMLALAALLAEQNKGGARGGGDLHPWKGGPGYEGREVPQHRREDELMNEFVGRWAGEKIAVLGDYGEDSDPVWHESNPWRDEDEWTDISKDALLMIRMDHYTDAEQKDRDRYRPDEYAEA